jgi:hypothetical protein
LKLIFILAFTVVDNMDKYTTTSSKSKAKNQQTTENNTTAKR